MRSINSRTDAAAFTLIESLIVISLIGAATAMAFTLSSKRRAIGAELVCAQKEAALSQAQFQYMNEYKGQYAGINTSGAYYQGLYPGQNPAAGWTRLLGNSSANLPTSTWDWIAPLVGTASNFSPNRALRLQQELSVWACPSVMGNNDSLYGSATDRADFDNAFTHGGFRQVSYLQSSAFHLYSGLNTNVPRAGVIRLKQGFVGAVADSPVAFSPRLFNVGAQPAMKVMHADGTRYVGLGGFTDIDINVNQSVNGYSTDYSPADILSVAYSHSDQSNSHGYGHKYSFRHASGKINAAFYDGSVRSIGKEEAWTEAKYWFPGGSTFTGNGATPESLTRYTPGTILP